MMVPWISLLVRFKRLLKWPMRIPRFAYMRGLIRRGSISGGKAITISGLDPCDLGRHALPILDANGLGTVVIFRQNEDANSVLSGFVLTGGHDEVAGAILCQDSSPTIQNCLLVGNRTTGSNSGIVYLDHSDAILRNCTIHGNYAHSDGAALWVADSNTVVTSSILWDNLPQEIHIQEGNDPIVSYCDVLGGWYGLDNINEDPLFCSPGYWGDSTDSYVMLEPSNPAAIWIHGDYHLQSEAGRWDTLLLDWLIDMATSPCIDTGGALSPTATEPGPNGDAANMGAYGETRQASKSGGN